MRTPQHDLTPTGYMKTKIAQVCTWVKNAWDFVKTESVVKSFKKCSISNALDGTEDDIFFENSSNDELDERISELPAFEDDDRSDEFCGFGDD